MSDETMSFQEDDDVNDMVEGDDFEDDDYDFEDEDDDWVAPVIHFLPDSNGYVKESVTTDLDKITVQELIREHQEGHFWDYADFSGLALNSAPLYEMVIHNAKFDGADLSYASFYQSDLTGCSFINSEMYRTILDGTDLNDTNILEGQYLSFVTYDEETVWPKEVVLEQGVELTGYKYVQFREPNDQFSFHKAVIQVTVPADALRLKSYPGGKCRAERVKTVKVLPIEDMVEDEDYMRLLYNATEFFSPIHLSKVSYNIDEETVADAYDPNFLNICSSGIHFFLTEAEAQAYAGANF